MYNSPFESDESDEFLLTEFESDESDERLFRRNPGVRIPGRGPTVPPYTNPGARGPGAVPYALRSEVDAAFAKVRADIQENRRNLVSVTAQANTAVKNLATVSTRLDREVKKLRDEQKAMQQSNMLMTLLTLQPTTIENAKTQTLKFKAEDGSTQSVDVVTGTTKASNNMLPLVIASGALGGGGTGGDGGFNPLLLLAFMK